MILGFIDRESHFRNHNIEKKVDKKAWSSVHSIDVNFFYRYPFRQIFAVFLITFGIILATYASSRTLNKQKSTRNMQLEEMKPDFFRWLIGMILFRQIQNKLIQSI